MKRVWIGIGFLAALLALGFGVSIAMEAYATPVSVQLARAQKLAQDGQLDEAIILAQQAEQAWQEGWKLMATVADHTPMEEIDRMFAELAAYGQKQEIAEFAATSAGLSRLTQAMAQAHKLTWWNLT